MGSTCLPGLSSHLLSGGCHPLTPLKPLLGGCICTPPKGGWDCPKQDSVPTPGLFSLQETKGRRDLALRIQNLDENGKVKMGSGNSAAKGDEG